MTLEDQPALLRRLSPFRRRDISDFTYLLTYLWEVYNCDL